MPAIMEAFMQFRMWAGAAAIAIVLGVGTAMQAADSADDPFLWLEDIRGEKALDWVKQQNAVSLKQLKADPEYQAVYDSILAILDADDRIPTAQLHGRWAFNFWQDAAHVRGLWRRASIESYETSVPQWDTLLDVDRLAAAEGKGWVFKGARCSPDLSRCLVSLSPDGGDTVVLREFDPEAKRFVDEGFSLGEAKAEAAYVDRDTILFSTDFGNGTLTQSGYPRIVKRWKRGERLSDAKVVFEGRPEDVIVSPAVFQGADGTTPLVTRAVSYFETEYFYITPEGERVQLPLPLSVDVNAVYRGNLIMSLRKDWRPDGQAAIRQGTLAAFSLKEFLATRKMPRVSALYTPRPRASADRVTAGRDGVYASIYENVVGSVHKFTLEAGVWRDEKLTLPSGGSTGISSANDFGPDAYFSFQDFLTPATMFAERNDAAPAALKTSPARFDATPYASVQYEAVSKDGTKIPYFVVRGKDAKGPMPMVLYGYGGFEISQTPFYWASMGREWLPKGGAYAVANIRGGGEFGPAWHEAASKTNRQKAFDDFIAVAEDMIKRGLTTPKQLAVMGGSNGGLLVGTVAVERPDLFAAVVCQVPLLDMLRFNKLGAGASWVGEYGSPDIPEERAAILKYSPYQNVKVGVKYPSMFFVTATSDDRVTPVHARKMAAKMEMQGHDVLFYENTEGGHAAAANHAQAAEMNALTFVYLEQKLGLSK
jgi:prolyl oligopeptidase